ncbi:MAG: peptidase P60 [Candidatus Hydrogenedentes bacterium]|nr:peptidase P60 [Candidatus Hydrogenedentota bacterium]
MIRRSDIVEQARAWIGTRYKHQGRVRGVGVDCIGLVGGVALAVGVPNARAWADARDLHTYARTPDPTLLLGGCAQFFERTPAPREGDVLLFSLQGEPRHFAIITETRDGKPHRIVHAYALMAVRGVCEQSLPIARAHVLAAYSYKGVEV